MTSRDRAAASAATQERQAHRLHRRRLCVADRRQRSAAARLRGHDLRAVRPSRRPDAHQHPVVPPAGGGAERGDRRRSSAWASTCSSARRSSSMTQAARGQAVTTRSSSAPARRRARNCDLPGRNEAGANIHIGIDWLESVAFEHIESIGEQVLIIGVGNTAMDCCRTSLRLGANGRQGDGAQAAAVSSRPRTGSWRTPKKNASRSSSTTRRRRS